MPLINNHDKNGRFWKYGKTGKKYYYKAGDSYSRSEAKIKAIKQGRVIEIKKHVKK